MSERECLLGTKDTEKNNINFTIDNKVTNKIKVLFSREMPRKH